MEPVTACTRCGGFSIPEAFHDVGLASVGWRCLLCGEIVDGVILKNRAVPFIPSPMDEEPADWLCASHAEDSELEAVIEG